MPALTKPTASVILAATIALSLLSSCPTREAPEEVFSRLAEPFVFDALAFTPIAATAIGYHDHIRGGAAGEEVDTYLRLDELLDDYSPQAVERRISFYTDFRSRLRAEIARDSLAGDAWVDYGVIERHIDQALLELQSIRSHEHNPVLYARLLGTALYLPLVFEYAPETVRYVHLAARLEQVPAFLEQAKQNLQSSPSIWTEVARQANEGNIRLVEVVIPANLSEEVRRDYEAVSERALQALRDFDTYLTTDLASRNQHDWRLGIELYARKLRVQLGTESSPEDVLTAAEQEFAKLMSEAITVAEALDKKIFGSARPPADKMAMMSAVVDILQDENRLRSADQLLQQVKQDVDRLRSFVDESNLAPMPPRDNLQIVETPQFMRDIFPVSGFLGAPALEPGLNSFYWVTPFPADLPRARLNTKLQEYNRFALQFVSVQEAMPGSYVQHEFANEIAVPSRRALRSAFPDAPYVEGWRTYIAEAMVNAGMQNQADETKLSWYRLALGVVADTIVDIKMHTMNMTDEEALILLRDEAFQGSEEARNRLLRAKVTSAQLPMSFVGWKEWLRVRDHYQKTTNDFSLASFHAKGLGAGPAHLSDLGYLLAERPMEN